MLKGAVVGCGFFADNHLNAWREVPGVEIVALCDTDTVRLTGAAAKFAVPATYRDIDAMLADEKLDFVDVATGPATHRLLVEKVAAAGVAVICQKPVALTLADAKAMVAACDAAGVTFMVHENFRFQRPLRAVKAALEEGVIGEPFFGRVSFRSGYDIFSGQPYLATEERFIVADLGIHVLDVARFLFGEVSRLTASTCRVNPDIRGEDAATALMQHEGGVMSVVDCSYTSYRAKELFPQTLVEIDGSAGSIVLDADYRLTVHARGGETVVSDVDAPVLPWAARPWHVVQESVRATEAHFAECLASGREPATSGHDNLKTYALVDAVYRSAAGPLATVSPAV